MDPTSRADAQSDGHPPGLFPWMHSDASRGLLASVLRTFHDSLGGAEPHRLLALIVEDVGRYPQSRIGDIHQRIGLEIPRSRIRRAIEQLVKDSKLQQEGVRSGTRYRLA